LLLTQTLESDWQRGKDIFADFCSVLIFVDFLAKTLRDLYGFSLA
jgi:hypothetical protein